MEEIDPGVFTDERLDIIRADPHRVQFCPGTHLVEVPMEDFARLEVVSFFMRAACDWERWVGLSLEYFERQLPEHRKFLGELTEKTRVYPSEYRHYYKRRFWYLSWVFLTLGLSRLFQKKPVEPELPFFLRPRRDGPELDLEACMITAALECEGLRRTLFDWQWELGVMKDEGLLEEAEVRKEGRIISVFFPARPLVYSVLTKQSFRRRNPPRSH